MQRGPRSSSYEPKNLRLSKVLNASNSRSYQGPISSGDAKLSVRDVKGFRGSSPSSAEATPRSGSADPKDANFSKIEAAKARLERRQASASPARDLAPKTFISGKDVSDLAKKFAATTTFSSGVSETARRSASRDRKTNVASPSRSQTGPTEKHVRSQRSEVVQKTTKAEKQEKNEKQARDASADAVPIAITPAMLGRLTAQTWPEAYKPPDTAANDDQTKTRTDASRLNGKAATRIASPAKEVVRTEVKKLVKQNSSQDSAAATVMEAKPRSHSSSDGESRVRRAAPASAAIKKGHKSDAAEKQRALSSSSVAETKRSRSKGQVNAIFMPDDGSTAIWLPNDWPRKPKAEKPKSCSKREKTPVAASGAARTSSSSSSRVEARQQATKTRQTDVAGAPTRSGLRQPAAKVTSQPQVEAKAQKTPHFKTQQVAYTAPRAVQASQVRAAASPGRTRLHSAKQTTTAAADASPATPTRVAPHTSTRSNVTTRKTIASQSPPRPVTSSVTQVVTRSKHTPAPSSPKFTSTARVQPVAQSFTSAKKHMLSMASDDVSGAATRAQKQTRQPEGARRKPHSASEHRPSPKLDATRSGPTASERVTPRAPAGSRAETRSAVASPAKRTPNKRQVATAAAVRQQKPHETSHTTPASPRVTRTHVVSAPVERQRVKVQVEKKKTPEATPTSGVSASADKSDESKLEQPPPSPAPVTNTDPQHADLPSETSTELPTACASFGAIDEPTAVWRQLKQSHSATSEPAKSILKPSQTAQPESAPAPILKHKEHDDAQHPSILKKRSSEDLEKRTTHSILKSAPDSDVTAARAQEPKPILKHAAEVVDVETTSAQALRPILKRESTSEESAADDHPSNIRSILKNHSPVAADVTPTHTPQTPPSPAPASILRATGAKQQRSRSFGESDASSGPDPATTSESAQSQRPPLRKAKTLDSGLGAGVDLDSELKASLKARRGPSVESEVEIRRNSACGTEEDTLTGGISIAQRISLFQSKLTERRPSNSSTPLAHAPAYDAQPHTEPEPLEATPSAPAPSRTEAEVVPAAKEAWTPETTQPHPPPPPQQQQQQEQPQPSQPKQQALQQTPQPNEEEAVRPATPPAQLEAEQDDSEQRRQRFQASRSRWMQRTTPGALPDAARHDRNITEPTTSSTPKMSIGATDESETREPEAAAHSALPPVVAAKQRKERFQDRRNFRRFRSLPDLPQPQPEVEAPAERKARTDLQDAEPDDGDVSAVPTDIVRLARERLLAQTAGTDVTSSSASTNVRARSRTLDEEEAPAPSAEEARPPSEAPAPSAPHLNMGEYWSTPGQTATPEEQSYPPSVQYPPYPMYYPQQRMVYPPYAAYPQQIPSPHGAQFYQQTTSGQFSQAYYPQQFAYDAFQQFPQCVPPFQQVQFAQPSTHKQTTESGVATASSQVSAQTTVSAPPLAQRASPQQTGSSEVRMSASLQQRIALRQQREEAEEEEMLAANADGEKVGSLVREVEESGRLDLSRDSMTLSDISTSSSLFAGVHASDVSARESEDSDDWDALVEINARTLIADTTSDAAGARQTRAHVPSPLATEVRQNGHYQPDAAPTLTHRTAPRQDAREPGRQGDAATRSDECAAPDAAAETEHASSVFHVVRAQFESSDGSDGRSAGDVSAQHHEQTHSSSNLKPSKDLSWPPVSSHEQTRADDVIRVHRPHGRNRLSNLVACYESQSSEDDVTTHQDANRSLNNNRSADASESCTDVTDIERDDVTNADEAVQPLVFVAPGDKIVDSETCVTSSSSFVTISGVSGETDVDTLRDVSGSSDSDDTDTCCEQLAPEEPCQENDAKSQQEPAEEDNSDEQPKSIEKDEVGEAGAEESVRDCATPASSTSSRAGDESLESHFDSLAAKYVRDINENETQLDSSLELFTNNATCDSSSLSSLLDDVTLVDPDVTDDALPVSESRSEECCSVECAKVSVASASATALTSHKQEATDPADVMSTNTSNNNVDVKRPLSEKGPRLRETRKAVERRHRTQVVGDRRADERRTTPSRHLTQPVTPDEKAAIKQVVNTAPPSVSVGTSIADRLAALQKNGDEDWRRRIGKYDVMTDKRPTSNVLSRVAHVRDDVRSEGSPVQMRKEPHLRATDRPSSIADRLSLLGNAQEGWRTRVAEKDMSRFTVEGKMTSAGKTASPRKVEKRATPDAAKSKMDAAKLNIPAVLTFDSDNDDVSSDDDVKQVEVKQVVVPRNDDETFSAFFESSSMTSLRSAVAGDSRVTVSIDDFDHVFLESENILAPTKRKIRAPQRKKAASRNPIKTLRTRDDVSQQTYSEEKREMSAREALRFTNDPSVANLGLASEALAGLASTESFCKSKLRKAESFRGAARAGEKFLPYKDLMLMSVKGRRTCQTRLVKPRPESINSGDAYILVVPDKVFVWHGQFCNVIEKAKASDVACTIQQRRDLGCKSSVDPINVYDGPTLGSSGKEFWNYLGGFEKHPDAGPADEDEWYESSIQQTNMVYRVKGEKLAVCKEHWGAPLQHSMLSPKEMFVFDFGCELYLWIGKQVAAASRKVGLKLVEEIWANGYDYSAFDVNPISPLSNESDGGYPKKGSKRPSWALMGKVNQNMETILFREKFLDWPESGKFVKRRTQEKGQKPVLKRRSSLGASCNVIAMLHADWPPVDLVLENNHLGRGDEWVDSEDGIRKVFSVETLSVTVWHVLEFERHKVDDVSFGQLLDSDTYVLKWHYVIRQTGIRSLKGQEARQAESGRERCAYFFWQGANSSVNEKGASALMTVDLDQERGPQVRVSQGKEPAAFVRLFGGRMVIHRSDKTRERKPNAKLFISRNEIEAESYLQEITPCVSCLRSRASFLLLNTASGRLFVWHGAKSTDETRACALTCAQHLAKSKPPELEVAADLSVQEVEEGSEPDSFWKTLTSSKTVTSEEVERMRRMYDSLLEDEREFSHTPRMFHLSSLSGRLESSEALNLCRSNQVTPFLTSQHDLLSVPQPGLFLVDNEHEVLLWQGAWPEQAEGEGSAVTGSAQSRFVADRRLAMELCLEYCQAKSCENPPRALIVNSGLEPVSFTNLFPVWERNEKLRDAQLQEGKVDGQVESIEELLAKWRSSRYSWSELLSRPLPDGVDPAHLEQYLQEDDFEKNLSITRDAFEKLPQWKQNKIKRDSGLF